MRVGLRAGGRCRRSGRMVGLIVCLGGIRRRMHVIVVPLLRWKWHNPKVERRREWPAVAVSQTPRLTSAIASVP